MLVRLILLAVLAVGGFFVVRSVLGPKRLRLPVLWRSVAQRHPEVKRALESRTAIARLMLDEPEPKFKAVIGEVDQVIAGLVRLARAREEKGLTAGEAEQTALADLDALYHQIRDEAVAETEDDLDRLRSRLGERSEDLRQLLEARRELDGG